MLHIVQILEATTGGTRRHLRELVLGLSPNQFRIDVIVSTRRNPDIEQDLALFRDRGIGVHVITMFRRPAPLADAVALIRLTRLLRRLRPDVIHTHSSKAGFLGRLAAHHARIPAVHTPHAFACEMSGWPWQRALYRAVERFARRWTTRLIAVSTRERALGLRLGYRPGQVALIPNGLAPAATPAPRAADHAPAVVGFVGRLCSQKGPDILLAAVPRILAAEPATVFRLVGDGPWRRSLEKRVESMPPGVRVTFVGATDEAGVARERTGFDIEVIPSRWDGLSYTLLDALQAGVPVVAADVGGVRDAAGDDGAAIVPPDDPPALAAEIVRLLKTPAERERLAAAGPRHAAGFTLERMVEQTGRVYREAAG